jgi:UPF0755 protein
MPPLDSYPQRFIAATQKLQDRMSTRWREHTNRRTSIILSVLALIMAGTYYFFVQPPREFPIGALVEVKDGQSVSELAQSLEDQQVIKSPLAFKAFIMMLGTDRSVRAGDYLFKERLSAFRVAQAMSRGSFGLEPIRIRIPEGATVREMAVIYDARLLKFNAANFEAQATPMEGYLFPDTYFFLPNATEDKVIQTMRQNFDTKIATLNPPMASSTRSMSDIIKMASLIEREARNSEDRRKISSVLWNRIDKDMALQVDVTFLYTIGKGTFDLTVEDLKSDSPYNTYVNKGLPPTPIGSPSLDAIQAAISPAKTDFLYFMADYSGVTHFCKTYSCHVANKHRYY